MRRVAGNDSRRMAAGPRPSSTATSGEGDLQVAYPPWSLPDGRSLILAVTEDGGGEVQTTFDGETVALMPPQLPDFQWMATSPDGSTWGISRGELLVIPAVAPVSSLP